MNNYRKILISLAVRLLLLMAVYTFVRLCFFIFNYSHFQLPFWQVVTAFVAGLRFDLSAIIYTNIPFILLHVVPGNWESRPSIQKINRYYFLIINSLCLIANFIDIGYYSYVLKRSTFDFFHLLSTGNDVITLLPAYLADFWYILLLWIISVVILYKLYPFKNQTFESEKLPLNAYLKQTPIALILLILFAIGTRGGTQLRPINSLTATRYVPSDKIALVTNTTFTIINSYGEAKVEPLHYFTEEELSATFTPEQAYINFNREPIAQNVVIIILESFNAEYSRHLSGNESGYTPFLDSLMEHSITFRRAYANAKKSIEALPAILSGIPALMDFPYVSTRFHSNSIQGIPWILKNNGYSTHFFHGGTNGTMGFDNFTRAAGVQFYYGLNEYKGNKEDYDGAWGIYDEPYLQYVADVLDTVTTPFFAGIFTLSSHHPYQIPEKYADKFPEGNIPILKTIAYTDFALQRFFHRAQQSLWYNNTLFVITADHTSLSLSKKFSNPHGSYRIPLLFHVPENPKAVKTLDYVVQHTDIYPSVIHYLGINRAIVSYGSSVFARDTGWTVNYLNGVYQLITDSLLLQFDGEKLQGIYNPVTDPLLKENRLEEYEQVNEQLNFLKAVIQDYRFRLINNRLTSKWPVE